MKRRLTAMGLAVAALLAGALQLSVDPANGQTPTPTSLESPSPGPTISPSPSAPCPDSTDSVCRFTGTVVVGVEDCRFLNTENLGWIGPLVGILGFQLQPGARVTVTGTWRSDLPTFCSTPFQAQFVVSAVELLGTATPVPTASPPSTTATPPSPTVTPLVPLVIPATGHEPAPERTDTLPLVAVVALLIGCAALWASRVSR